MKKKLNQSTNYNWKRKLKFISLLISDNFKDGRRIRRRNEMLYLYRVCFSLA